LTKYPVWAALGALILIQICYPLTSGSTRAALTVLTVFIGYIISVGHAVLTRGARTALALITTATLGGFAVEAVGVATGFPFGAYDYSGELGPKLLGVPLIIPLAWTWMAWPAWIAAGHLSSTAGGRIAIGAVGLATWDLFLDPQMVAAGYWRWSTGDVPVRNYLAWLLVAAAMMALLQLLTGAQRQPVRVDAPVLVLYLWTYASSVLAHAVFLDLPRSALIGGLGMGLVALPLAFRLAGR